MNEETKQLLEDVKAGVTEEVFKKIKEELPNRKDIFGGDNAKSEEKEQKEKAAEFIKAAFDHDGAKMKSLSEGTPADGGYLVPEAFSSEIIRLAPNFGVVRQDARIYPVSTLKTHLPTADSITAYRVAEKAKITASKPTIGQTNIEIKKIAAMVPMSNELLKDANVATVSLLSTLAAEAFAKYEDEWGFLGKLAGEGIFQNTDVPVVTLGSGDTTYAKLDADDLLDMLSTIDESALPGAKWYMSFSVFNAIRKLKASTTGEYIVQQPAGGLPPTIWNVPVKFVRSMPKTSDVSQAGAKFLTLANMGYMLFGDRQQITMDISTEATVTDTDGTTPLNLFEQDMSAVRLIERIDVVLAEATKAFVVAKTAAS